MSTWTDSLLALMAAVLALLACASTRRLRVAAPADRLGPLVGELRGFKRWNPHETRAPLTKGPYASVASGIGSRHAWQRERVGTGSFEITGQQAGRAVHMRFGFLKPFKAHNQAESALQPTPDGATEVIWQMHGPAHFMSQLMGTFMDMDKMVGREFEDGLQNLRQIGQASNGKGA